MEARLEIQSAKTEPFVVTIGNTATIGRTRENTVCLNASPLVSRQHALIRGSGDGHYQLIDLGSRNGTYLNDQRVVFPVALTPGARIRIGDHVLTFLAAECSEESSDLQMTVAATQYGSGGFTPRSVALLVCDIRGFSQMSERLGAAELAPLLGEWFRETGNRVQRTGGTVDKFLGDALLAYWAGAQDGPLDCGAALGMAREFLQLAASRRWPNGQPLEIAIALHYGRVTLSNVGLSAERDATIIGDAVNTVFRLEGVTKVLGQRVLLSQEFATQLAEPPPLQDFGEQTLKGKTNTVRVFGFAG